MMDHLISADKELNEGDFSDAFAHLNFPSAEKMNDTREKVFLKVLQTIPEHLYVDDPQQAELQAKAIHSIAAEYIKNRKGGDILIGEL